MNTILKVNHAKICLSQLNSKEKELFAGLDDVCKGSGRIYKRLDKDGHYTFFRAGGFFSQIYHFIFSKRLDKNDLVDLQGKVADWLNTCPDSSSKYRVEAVYDRVLRQVKKNDHVGFKETENLVYNSGVHFNMVLEIIHKLKILDGKPSDGPKYILSQGEMAVLREILKFPSHPFLSLHESIIEKVQKGEHPICKALEVLQGLDQSAGEIKRDIPDLKLRAKSSQLSEEEVETILLAKAKLAELKNRWSGYLDIESFRPAYKGLDQLIELSNMDDPQIVQALNNRKTAEKLVQKNGWLFSFLSEDLKEDFGLASIVLTRNPNEFVIVKEVVQRFGELLILASAQAKDNDDIVALAVKNNPRAFEMASKRIQTSHLDIAKLAIENRSARPELVKFILKQNGRAFQYAPEKYKNDSDFVKLVVRQYPLALPYLPEEQRKAFIQEKLNAVSSGERVDQSSLEELEVIANQTLKDPSWMKDDKLKTTFWVICEDIAQSYLKFDANKAIAWRVKVAQAISPGSPLNNLQDRFPHEDLRLGFRLTPVDTSLFKNQTLAIQRQTFTDGHTHIHLEAKLSHPARAKLKETLNYASSKPVDFFNALPVGFCKKVTTSTTKVGYCGRVKDINGKKFVGAFSSDISNNGFSLYATQQIINFEGVGKVKIGNNPDYHAEYNRIEIDLEPGISEAEAADKLNIIFAALGLGPVNSSSRDTDIERIKIMQLFRAFYPQQAYRFERDKESYNQSLQELKNAIGIAVPDMKQKFKHYLEDHPELMYQQEIYPGQSVWAIRGLAQEVRNRGGMGLMSGITADNFQDASYRLASILKMGALSTQDRFKLGIIAAGASSEEDLRTGGGESVFARLLTKNMPKNPNQYSLQGKMQVLYDLDLIERVGYAYSADKYGSKVPGNYDNRSSILDLASKYSSEHSTSNLSNEVCIRNRVPPRFIKGILVSSQAEKDLLINTLRAEGLITKNGANIECANDVPVDQFIHIGEFKAEYWA